MSSKGIFLKLQQLHHKPGQSFIGRSICLNILKNKYLSKLISGSLHIHLAKCPQLTATFDLLTTACYAMQASH